VTAAFRGLPHFLQTVLGLMQIDYDQALHILSLLTYLLFTSLYPPTADVEFIVALDHTQ
jgi:hypothetical protein